MRRAAIGVLLLALAGCAQGSGQSAPTGYATPDEAFAALRVRPDVRFRRQAGWTVAEDRSNHTVWSFAPPGHLAYPAAVRRQVVERDGSMVVEVRVLCDRTSPACEELARNLETSGEVVRPSKGDPAPTLP